MEGQIASPATVDYSVTDGTAVQGSDYLIPPGQTLTFLPDQTFPDTVSVFTNADPAAVADKSFTVTLVNPVGDITLDSSQAIITLVEPASAVVGPGSPDPAVDPSTPPAPDASSSSLGGIQPLTLSTPVASITGPYGVVTGGSVANFLLTLSPAPSACALGLLPDRRRHRQRRAELHLGQQFGHRSRGKRERLDPRGDPGRPHLRGKPGILLDRFG